MATLRDVAREAGVSVATASVVLRGEPGFKPETRDRILKAAEKVHYTANISARFLKQGSSGIIAFVVPELSNPYFSDLAWAISKEAARQGYQTVVVQTNSSTESERDSLKRVSTPMCDGLIINLHNIPEGELQSLIGGHPAVLFEDYEDHPQYDNVSLPLEASFRTAFAYLKQRGYAHVAIAGGRRFAAEEFAQAGRNTGSMLAVRAMIAAGLGEESDTIPCEWTVEGGAKAASTIVQADLGYDAVFCMNDLIAFGLIRGLTDMGIRVPEDKAVFGFDGVSPTAYFIPQLSTIAVDFDGMARSAVSMLIERIKGGDMPARRETAGFSLIRGGSA
ncbi:LacI family DNA-binding transcriptional regulator [Bifidobacterium sp. MA2]|uniref:LacI family DNA-binding transcriptional regulator n=1 Tax=Bifidobacterium santillanense TaxID=2809028 RepID=A0ABS5UN53_9BIFI|nr:LacI family DNA-binding transcriptional regulator [Bifidobacterium santillanense]MBT1172341.1 LacI family DNA-binding transcriptional regulator [Bifidobacterium santillanense]